MAEIIPFAEFQYRQKQRDDDRCKRIAEKMLQSIDPGEPKAIIGTIALEDWLNAGNGRDKSEKED